MDKATGCASASTNAEVLIVGAGIAGLACAVALLPVTSRITLAEASAHPGGCAASWADATTGDTVDIGPHIVLSEYRNMLRFLDMLGTRDAIVWQTDKLLTLLEHRRRTVVRVHRLPPPLHLVPSLLATRAVSLRDKRSNLPALKLAMGLNSADIARLDQVNAYELLLSLRVSPRFIDWFWRTAALTVMNLPLERCSAGALLRVYAQIMGHNDYRVGFAATGLGDLYVPRSRELLAQAGGTLRTNCRIGRLLIEQGRCVGAVTADGEELRARHTVLAVPPQAARALMPHGAADAWKIFEPSPYISVYLWFDRKLTHERFWTRVWNPADLNSDFYDLSNIRAGWSQRPSLIASNIIYSARVAHLDDTAIVTQTLRELSEFAPEAAEAQLLHAVVHRIPMAIPCPVPGSEAARPPTRSPIAGLLLAGDWIDTGIPCSMESAVCAGFKAAEAIARDDGAALDLALPLRPPEGICALLRKHA